MTVAVNTDTLLGRYESGLWHIYGSIAASDFLSYLGGHLESLS
jgi:hypothetical protein